MEYQILLRPNCNLWDQRIVTWRVILEVYDNDEAYRQIVLYDQLTDRETAEVIARSKSTKELAEQILSFLKEHRRVSDLMKNKSREEQR